MKLALYRIGRLGFLALLIFSGGAELFAQPSDRPRGNAIIFSAPKSDTVASNLNELRPANSPFREMESSLKKPFELFEPGKNSAPTTRGMPMPRQPELKRKTEKEMLNQRAEEMFLEPGLHPGETDDDLFKAGETLADPLGRKPKTALDRYYDRMDRAATNRASGPDSLGGARDARNGLEASIENPFNENGNWDRQRSPFGNRLGAFSPQKDNSRNGFFGDNERSSGNSADLNSIRKPEVDYGGFQQPKVDRLEAFKQLLGGSSAPRTPAPRGSYNYNYGTPPPAAAIGQPTAGGDYSSATKPLDPRTDFTKSAGLIGAPSKPQGLPDYTAGSVSTPNTAPKPIQVPTFNIPKRRF